MAELIPVIRGRMGGHDYYVGKMNFQELATKVQRYSDVKGENPALEERLQRQIQKRSRDMTEYLKRQKERFYGAVIVATWGGRPEYIRVRMEDHPLLDDAFEFGLLRFDGRQDYFALDGQHRLQSIREAIEEMPELRREEVSVIFVTHDRTEDGNVKTRRLFHTLNKYARPTTTGENIVFDEDNVVAIATRRLLGGGIAALHRDRVEVERKNLLKGQVYEYTSLAGLYDFNIAVLSEVYSFSSDKDYLKFRPDAEHEENAYEALRALWLQIEERVPELCALRVQGKDAGSFREPGGKPEAGHLLFRPLGLKIMGSVVGRLVVEQKGVPLPRCERVDPGLWDVVLEQAFRLPLVLGELPWRGTILRGKRIVTGGYSLARRLALYMLDVGGVDQEKLESDYCAYLEDDKAQLPSKVV